MEQIIDTNSKSSEDNKSEEQNNTKFDERSEESFEEINYEKSSEQSEESEQGNDNDNGHCSDGLFNGYITHITKVMDSLKRNDIKSLKSLATVGFGFINDSLRQKIWPKLIRVCVVETSPRPDSQTIESHPFYNQVVLDVNRSLKRFPPCIGHNERISMQDSLIRLIMRVLIKNPELHYFQGYHDICVTFLMILGEEMAFYCVNQLSKTHFKAYMEKTMEKTSDLLDIIPIIIRYENPSLSNHLESSQVGTIFALSWVITWFSHVLPKYEDVARLFDFFIATNSLMPLYLTAALVLHKDKQILALDCDMPSIHQFLTKVPETEDLPIETLIGSALQLIQRYPPNDMIKEQHLERIKKNDLKAKIGKNSLFISFRYVCRSLFQINFMSITIFIIFFAVIYQFYWNF